MSKQAKPAPPSEPLDLHAIYERYGRAVYRRCQFFLHDNDDARDAMHDVFVKASEHRAAFRGASSPLTWLIRITTNHCLNIIRSRGAAWHGAYERTIQADHAARQPHEVERVEREQFIRRVLSQADPQNQAAAIHYWVDGMSQEDAAVACDCSVPTLRKRLRAFVKDAQKELKSLPTPLLPLPAREDKDGHE